MVDYYYSSRKGGCLLEEKCKRTESQGFLRKVLQSIKCVLFLLAQIRLFFFFTYLRGDYEQ